MCHTIYYYYYCWSPLTCKSLAHIKETKKKKQKKDKEEENNACKGKENGLI
jgi:hypothetical protein